MVVQENEPMTNDLAALTAATTLTLTVRGRTWNLRLDREINGYWIATRNGRTYNVHPNNRGLSISVFSAGGYYTHTLNRRDFTVTAPECRTWAHVPGIACRCCGRSTGTR
jgi:hypothetical protein